MWACRVLFVVGGFAVAFAAFAVDTDWKRGKLERLAPLIGTYYHDRIFADPEVANELAMLLPAGTLSLVRQNLQVVAPVDFISGHLVVSGNRAHYGGEEMAWVWISVYDGTAKVVLLHDGVLYLFAATERYEYLPIALRASIAAPPLEFLFQPPEGLCWVKSEDQTPLRPQCTGTREKAE